MPTLFQDRVVINGVVFNDRNAMPIPGLIYWGLDVLDPWDSTPEIDMVFARIGVVDGEIPGEVAAYAGKQYTIGGYVLAEDREIAQSAWETIVRDVIPRGADVVIRRDEPTPKFTTVRLNGPREPQWVGPTGFRWAAQARAYDSFRYAVEPWEGEAGVAGQIQGGRVYPRVYPLVYNLNASGGTTRVEALNSGTSDTPKWYVNLSGPLAAGSWRIVNETTGALLRIGVEVPEGSLLTIDMQAETATLDGAIVNATVTGDFFRLVPGVNMIRLFGDYDPAARINVTAYSAWD